MADVRPIPEGFATLTPHLTVDGARKALELYSKAFGAEELHRHETPGSDKLMHALVRIGDSMVMLNDDFPEMCGGKRRSPEALGESPVTLHLYVEDCDAAFRRAVDAGCTSEMEPADMFWGDRYAVVRDPFGHRWSIATHVADPTPEEMEAAAKKAFGR